MVGLAWSEILLILGVLGIVLLFVVIMAVIWLIGRGLGGHRRSAQYKDEARVMQEIYLGLQKMEERTETLEVLLDKHSRKDEDTE